MVREAAIGAGLLPVAAHIPLVDAQTGPLPAPAAGLVRRLPSPRRVPRAEQTQGACQRRHWLLHPGHDPAAKQHPHLRRMGSSIGQAHGAAKAGSPEHHVAVLGDSTFFHTGISALINVVYNQAPIVTIIMDNRVTGMTGHQENPGTGHTLQDRNRRSSKSSRWCVPAGSGTSRPYRLRSRGDREDTQGVPEARRAGRADTREAVRAAARRARKRWVPLEVLAERLQRLHDLLPHRVSCDPEERRTGRDATAGRRR